MYLQISLYFVSIVGIISAPFSKLVLARKLFFFSRKSWLLRAPEQGSFLTAFIALSAISNSEPQGVKHKLILEIQSLFLYFLTVWVCMEVFIINVLSILQSRSNIGFILHPYSFENQVSFFSRHVFLACKTLWAPYEGYNDRYKDSLQLLFELGSLSKFSPQSSHQ